MMNYEKFKIKFQEEFVQYLPAAYAGWTLEIDEMPKVNGYRDAATLRPEEKNGCTPVLYLDELYDYYKQCEDFVAVLRKAAVIFVLGIEHVSRMRPQKPSEIPKESIIYTLIPYEGNERLLSDAPYRVMMDLALLYRICIPTEDGGFDSAVISHELAKEMGLSEEKLYELAVENTPRILPLEIHETDECFSVVTNEKRTLGAAAMMYPGVLEHLAKGLDSDLFILPASIHEVFIVADVGQSVEEMNQMVEDANRYMVRKEEILSNHVYYYHRGNKQVTIPPVYTS